MKTNLFVNDTWENYIQSIPDNSIDLVFTDPPYNISPENFLKEAFRVLVPAGSILIFTSDILLCQYLPLCERLGFFNKKTIVWEKINPITNFRLVNYRNATEFIFWATKGRLKKNSPNWIFLKQEEMKNIFKFPLCGGKERVKNPVHPCQKPLSICREIIKRHCRPGGIVLDFFGGVGSVALAAYSLGRWFISVEMDNKYHKQAEKRILEYQVIVEEETDDFEQIKLF